MASGVAVDADCVCAFQDIKANHLHRYVVFRLTEDLKKICVEKRAPLTASYDDLVCDLKCAQEAKQCRYAVYDAEFSLENGQKRSKLAFIVWSPDSSAIKQKMVYSSSKDALKKALNISNKDFQANDEGDLAWSNVLESLKQFESAKN